MSDIKLDVGTCRETARINTDGTYWYAPDITPVETTETLKYSLQAGAKLLKENVKLRAYCDGLRKLCGPYSTAEVALKALREDNDRLRALNAEMLEALRARAEVWEHRLTWGNKFVDARRDLENEADKKAHEVLRKAKAEKEGGAK